MNRIRWGCVIGLAFSLEAMLFATLLPIQSLLSLGSWFVAVAVGCALFGFIAGRLVSRGLPSGALLHGFLVGVAATVIYIVVNTFGNGGLSAAVTFYGAPLFVSLNALKIAACVAGAIRSKTPVDVASAA